MAAPLGGFVLSTDKLSPGRTTRPSGARNQLPALECRNGLCPSCGMYDLALKCRPPHSAIHPAKNSSVWQGCRTYLEALW